MLTIGELAKQTGLRTSALRYYEQEGLLLPADRTEAGYRLYAPESIDTVRLIQRAQRLGFSLTEIRTLMDAWQAGNLDDQAVLNTAESRHLALERQLTELRVLQHELELFLQDLRAATETGGPEAAQNAFGRLVDRICANPSAEPPSHTVLDWLSDYTSCPLADGQAEALLRRLRGQHVHIWQEGDAYYILVVSHDPQVGEALQELARLEAGCQVHPQLVPELVNNDEDTCLLSAVRMRLSWRGFSWRWKTKPLDFQLGLKVYYLPG
ncbi:MAG: MerR family transcriptional regulator [Chloroflexota bacterium]